MVDLSDAETETPHNLKKRGSGELHQAMSEATEAWERVEKHRMQVMDLSVEREKKRFKMDERHLNEEVQKRADDYSIVICPMQLSELCMESDEKRSKEKTE